MIKNILNLIKNILNLIKNISKLIENGLKGLDFFYWFEHFWLNLTIFDWIRPFLIEFEHLWSNWIYFRSNLSELSLRWVSPAAYYFRSKMSIKRQFQFDFKWNLAWGWLRDVIYECFLTLLLFSGALPPLRMTINWYKMITWSLLC